MSYSEMVHGKKLLKFSNQPVCVTTRCDILLKGQDFIYPFADLECKRKWNYLRGKFAREIKTDASGSLYFQMPVENDNSDDSHWPYFKNMLFLLPHCKKRS